MTKEEKRVYCRELDKKNRQRAKEYQKRWQEENPEKVQEYQQKYYDGNREKRIKATQEWRRKNADKVKEWRKSYRAKNGEKIRKYRRETALRTLYGLSPVEIERVQAQIAKGCEVCGLFDKHKNLCIDHSHTTGMFRGVLCANCNSALGQAKDSPELLRKLAVYLEAAEII